MNNPPSESPRFCPDEPVAERLVKVVTALTTEVAVLRERLDTYERLLADKGVVSRADLENYLPSEDVESERRAWRQDFLDRVFADIKSEIDAAIVRAGS